MKQTVKDRLFLVFKLAVTLFVIKPVLHCNHLFC